MEAHIASYTAVDQMIGNVFMHDFLLSGRPFISSLPIFHSSLFAKLNMGYIAISLTASLLHVHKLLLRAPHFCHPSASVYIVNGNRRTEKTG